MATSICFYDICLASEHTNRGQITQVGELSLLSL
jgi:hypothetical protein